MMNNECNATDRVEPSIEGISGQILPSGEETVDLTVSFDAGWSKPEMVIPMIAWQVSFIPTSI